MPSQNLSCLFAPSERDAVADLSCGLRLVHKIITVLGFCFFLFWFLCVRSLLDNTGLVDIGEWLS